MRRQTRGMREPSVPSVPLPDDQLTEEQRTTFLQLFKECNGDALREARLIEIFYKIDVDQTLDAFANSAKNRNETSTTPPVSPVKGGKCVFRTCVVPVHPDTRHEHYQMKAHLIGLLGVVSGTKKKKNVCLCGSLDVLPGLTLVVDASAVQLALCGNCGMFKDTKPLIKLKKDGRLDPPYHDVQVRFPHLPDPFPLWDLTLEMTTGRYRTKLLSSVSGIKVDDAAGKGSMASAESPKSESKAERKASSKASSSKATKVESKTAKAESKTAKASSKATKAESKIAKAKSKIEPNAAISSVPTKRQRRIVDESSSPPGLSSSPEYVMDTPQSVPKRASKRSTQSSAEVVLRTAPAATRKRKNQKKKKAPDVVRTIDYDDYCTDNDENHIVTSEDDTIEIDDDSSSNRLARPKKAARHPDTISVVSLDMQLRKASDDEFLEPEYLISGAMCWCGIVFDDSDSFDQHTSACAINRMVCARQSLRVSEVEHAALRQLRTVGLPYLKRFPWMTGNQWSKPASVPEPVRAQLRRIYTIITFSECALDLAMHPSVVVGVDGYDGPMKLPVDLLAIGAMVNGGVIACKAQFLAMLSNLRFTVRVEHGRASSITESCIQMCKMINWTLLDEAERACAVQPLPFPGPKRGATLLSAKNRDEAEDHDADVDEDEDDEAVHAPHMVEWLTDELAKIPVVGPVVDGPASVEDVMALQRILYKPEATPLAKEVEAAVARADQSDPSLVPLLLRRIRELEDAVNERYEEAISYRMRAKFALSQLDVKFCESVPRSQRLQARTTSFGTIQACNSLGAHLLADLDINTYVDDNAPRLRTFLDKHVPDAESAQQELREAADELVGVPYLTAAELRMYCFLRREFGVRESLRLADIRQWVEHKQFSLLRARRMVEAVTQAQNRDALSMTDKTAIDFMSGQGRVAMRQSNSLIQPLTPSAEECAAMSWEAAERFLEALVRYAVLRVENGLFYRVEPADLESVSFSVASRRTRPTPREWLVVSEWLRERGLSADDVRQFRNYKPRSEEVYGEANAIFGNQLIRALGITSNDLFYDIGSGIGNVVFQVAAITGARSKGIEIRTELHTIAEKFHAQIRACCQERNWTGVGQVELMEGDATVLPDLEASLNHKMRLQDADIVFCNNYVFSTQLEHNVFAMLTNTLKTGARVVVMRQFSPRFKPGNSRFKDHPLNHFKWPCDVYSTARDCVSWTSNAVSMFVYTYEPHFNDLDRSAGPGVRSEFNQLAAPR